MTATTFELVQVVMSTQNQKIIVKIITIILLLVSLFYKWPQNYLQMDARFQFLRCKNTEDDQMADILNP